MAQIFVSYSRKDRKRVAPLVKLLEEHGFDVWWDREIHPGEHFEEMLDRQVCDADCIVVIWSKDSIGSRWVMNEALEGMDRDILVPVSIDNVRIPLAFKQFHAADLTSWPESVEESEVISFISAIDEKLNSVTLVQTETIQNFVRSPSKSYLRSALVSIALLLMGALIYWAGYIGKESADSSDGRIAIAVTRFQNIGSDRHNFMSDSLSSELYLQLKAVDDLKLTSQLVMWDLPDELKLVEIAERLKVSFILEGKMLETSAGIVLRVVLYDQENTNIWESEFPVVDERIQLLRNRIVDQVVSILGLGSGAYVNLESIRQLTSNPKAYSLYLHGKELIRQSVNADSFRDSIRLMRDALAIDQRFAAAYASICRANIELFTSSKDVGFFEEAEKACHRALTLEPSDADSYFALGEMYLVSGNLMQAESEFNQSLKLDPYLSDAYLGLASIHDTRADLGLATNAYGEAIKVQPGYWRPLNEQGKFHFRQGQWDLAIEDFTQAIGLNVGNTGVMNNLATAYYLSGEIDMAVETWESCLDLAPVGSVYSNLGTSYYHLRRYGQAKDMYLKALEFSPDDHRLWGNVADVMRLSKKFESAHEYYQKAIELAEKILVVDAREAEKVITYARLAVYHAAIEDTVEASRYIQLSLGENVPNPMIHYDLALAQLLLGKESESLAYLESSLAMGFPDAIMTSDPSFDALRE